MSRNTHAAARGTIDDNVDLVLAVLRKCKPGEWLMWHDLRARTNWPQTGGVDMAIAIREARRRGLIECKGGDAGPAMIRPTRPREGVTT